MTKKFPLYLMASLIAACGLTTACNDNDSVLSSTSVISADYDNCAVTGFSLASDGAVLRNLDSVFFSIDLVRGEIYNADSLPCGTVTSHFKVNVNTASSSKVELTFKSRYSAADTTVNLTDNPNDSINLTNPASLKITSLNGQVTRTYNLKLNVHTVPTDTLVWHDVDYIFPPYDVKMKSAMLGEKIYTLLADADGVYEMYSGTDPNSVDGVGFIGNFELQGGRVETLTSTDDALYIADDQGKVYKSTDGLEWTVTDATMHCLYGGYGSTLLGARKDADGWKQVSLPATDERALPAGCPVSGTSQLILYGTKWSSSPLAIMIGGRDAEGSLTGQCWAYDGTTWSRVSEISVPAAEGITLFTYDVPSYPTGGWHAERTPALLAMGGKLADGTLSRKVYASYNYGITWSASDSFLQLPDAVGSFADSQAFVLDYELTVDDSTPRPITPSRVSQPVTSWRCPYIFLYGGYDPQGALYHAVRRGVITLFTLRPLY